jgi:hypothetical protein
MTKQRAYVAYLLRLWRVVSDDGAHSPVWRASVEDPHTGQRRGFADLDRLYDFLRQETEGVADAQDSPDNE